MFEEVAILYTWQSESNVLTKLVTQSERECLQVRDGIDKRNETCTALINLSEAQCFFCSFFTVVIYNFIYSYIINYQLFYKVHI
jgi:hypothetical protein